MQALNFYVIIDKIKEAPKKVGGLELTEKQNKDIRYVKGEVVSVGEGVPNIKPGNLVRYDKHAGHGIEYNEKLLFVIKATDIVIIE